MRILARQQGAGAVATGLFLTAFTTLAAYAQMPMQGMPPGAVVIPRFTEIVFTAGGFALIAWGAMHVRISRMQQDLNEKASLKDLAYFDRLAEQSQEHMRRELHDLRAEVADFRKEMQRGAR